MKSFQKNFTKAVPSKVLWEADFCFMGNSVWENKKIVTEEVVDNFSLGLSLKRALDKVETMSLKP